MYSQYRVKQNPFGRGWVLYDRISGSFLGQPGGDGRGNPLPYRTRKDALAAADARNEDWNRTMVSVYHGDVE